ncbi:GGDEF domain-containing protein [Levilactobacillus sp. HBUAS67488]|uniref:GGDEF domain-containing protein n=1 Tax=unclassified Levilactobacillus TaxID=2767918 RepID=UPI003FA55F11
MTWSEWFVNPALTSVFFLLGVLTLYWFMTSKLIKYLEKRKKNVRSSRVQAVVGVIYIMILIIVTQLAVKGTPNGWVFVNFQVFAVIFVSYFLDLNIHAWQIGLLILAYIGINGTFAIGLSWLFAAVFFGLYFAMVFIKEHRHTNEWRNFSDYTLVNLVFAVAMWSVLKVRFNLGFGEVAWQVLFSFFFMTITFVYINSVLAGANTLEQLTYTTNFDDLTHVRNYYSFKKEFSQDFTSAQEHQEPLTLMLFDIDHFKHVNDTYGHLRGITSSPTLPNSSRNGLKPSTPTSTFSERVARSSRLFSRTTPRQRPRPTSPRSLMLSVTAIFGMTAKISPSASPPGSRNSRMWMTINSIFTGERIRISTIPSVTAVIRSRSTNRRAGVTRPTQ